MTTTTHEDPATIEREIRRTQENMSSTVDRIGNQLSIKNVFNALLDKADENNIDARAVLDGARRNPIALGLIAAGAIWLVSDKDSKLPAIGSKTFKKNSSNKSGDVSHNDYVAHMSAVERGAGEPDTDYQRRRDTARSNFFMLERQHDEDENSFRQRLDAISDKFRDKRRAWGETTTDMQASAKQQAQFAATKAQDMYEQNPLVGGILAAAIGAAFASAIPVTRKEKDSLGSLGQKARGVVGDQAQELSSIVRQKKEALLDKADETLKKTGSSQNDSDVEQDNFNSSTSFTV
jgi:ElaB/YqjD/DUF883 family membrane-anchored ribosome-binding protein